MSYINMDHAGWVERNIACGLGMPDGQAKAKPEHTPPEKLSTFQARVMDILGIVGGGIYNAPIGWTRVRWNVGGGIFVPWKRDHMASFDFHQLTNLLFLCHEARIRVEVGSNGPRGMLLAFHQRSHEGGLSDRHPNITEAVSAFQAALPIDHHIRYQAERDDPLPARRAAHAAWKTRQEAEVSARQSSLPMAPA